MITIFVWDNIWTRVSVNGPNIFFKWANPGLFLFIFVLFSSQFKYKLKKHRCCAWGSNPGPQDGRCGRIHWAMAALILQLKPTTNVCFFFKARLITRTTAASAVTAVGHSSGAQINDPSGQNWIAKEVSGGFQIIHKTGLVWWAGPNPEKILSLNFTIINHFDLLKILSIQSNCLKIRVAQNVC